MQNATYRLAIATLLALAAAQAYVLVNHHVAVQGVVQPLEVGDRLPLQIARQLEPTSWRAHLPFEAPLARTVSERRCTVIVLFDSTCPFVAKAAPAWRGVTMLTRGRAQAGVEWVTISGSDTAAARFLWDHGLSGVGFQLPDRRARVAFGAVGTPSAYLVDAHGRVLDKPWPDPASIATLPAECEDNPSARVSSAVGTDDATTRFAVSQRPSLPTAER